MGSSMCFTCFKFCVDIALIIWVVDRPPSTHTYTHTHAHLYSVWGGGGGTWVQDLSTDIFNVDFGNFIFKRYQTKHNFEMLLIKWKSAYASGG